MRATGYTVGALLTAGVVYTGLGLIGSSLPTWLSLITRGAASLLLVWSFIWHARRKRFFRFGLRHIQANQHTAARGVPGALYFGAVLGPGILTKMATLLVQAGAVAAIALGTRWAIIYGLAFAIGRSIPVWIGLIKDTSNENAHEVAMGFVRRQLSTWWLGAAGALVGIAAVVLGPP